MTKLRVLIVDDEPLAREGVALMLREDPDVEVVGSCGDGRTALAEIDVHRPNLVFLDIQLPQQNGIDVLEKIRPDRRPAVIFITAYNEHAVRAFELSAVDYLLKPFRDQRFKAAVARAKEHVQRADFQELQRQAQTLIAHLRRLDPPRETPPALPPPSAQRLVFKVDGEHLFLDASAIAWIEAAGDFIRLGVAGQALLARDTINAVQQRLDAARFVRTHRSYIINIAAIRKISAAGYGDHDILMNDGTTIRLSRTYRDNLKRLLGH